MHCMPSRTLMKSRMSAFSGRCGGSRASASRRIAYARRAPESRCKARDASERWVAQCQDIHGFLFGVGAFDLTSLFFVAGNFPEAECVSGFGGRKPGPSFFAFHAHPLE